MVCYMGMVPCTNAKAMIEVIAFVFYSVDTRDWHDPALKYQYPVKQKFELI